MRWTNKETKESKEKNKQKWHEWFAWYPITIDHITGDGKVTKIKVWLERVMRKETMHYGGDEYLFYYTYKFMK